jgi:hypothetical protein
MAYLRHHYEPDNTTKLLKMQQRAKAYQVIGNELYKTSDIGPLLRCLSKVEGRELLAEIHLGVWGGGTLALEASQQKFSHKGFIGLQSLMMPPKSSQHAKPTKILTKLQSFVPTITTYHTFVGVAEMWHQHRGASDIHIGKLQIRSGYSRVLHKVDRREASSQHSHSGGQKVFLAEHNMLIQSAAKESSRQHQVA